MSSETYLNHKGILFPSKEYYTPEHLNYVENEFQLLDDDVVSVVYPKSGGILAFVEQTIGSQCSTTIEITNSPPIQSHACPIRSTHWMAEILSLIRNDGDPTWVRSVSVWDRMPWIETDASREILQNYVPPRFMSTHLPFQLFPKSFLHSKAKVIYTVRNPKDILVSLFHFSNVFKVLKKPGTMQDFLEEFLSGNVIFGSWFDHVKGWLAMKDKPNFFLISYEELQQDLRGSVERICHFLGKELNSQQIDLVVENASFETMKDNKMSNFTQMPDELMDHSKGKLMRKGKSGTWKNSLTVAQNERFDHVYQKNMRGVTVAFPWD